MALPAGLSALAPACFLLGAWACGGFGIKALFEVVQHRHEFLGHVPGQNLRTTRSACAECWPLWSQTARAGQGELWGRVPSVQRSWSRATSVGDPVQELQQGFSLLWGEECSRNRALGGPGKSGRGASGGRCVLGISGPALPPSGGGDILPSARLSLCCLGGEETGAELPSAWDAHLLGH